LLTLFFSAVNIQSTLGYGSSGTIVFRGTLGGRQVAVKRMLTAFYEVAKREVSLLLESDEHPHVVRYYAQEEDDQVSLINIRKAFLLSPMFSLSIWRFHYVQ